MVCLAAASFLFATTGAIIRVLSADVVTEVVVFYRNAVGLVLFVPVLLRFGLAYFKTEKIGIHLFRSLAGMSAMYAFFYAIAHYSLADAMLFVYASPVFVPVFAHFMLGEKVGGKHYGIALLGLAGIAIVFQPGAGIWSMLGIGLLCTFMSATAFVVVRKLSFTEPAERVVFYFTLFGTAISVIPMFWVEQSLTTQNLGLLVLVGLLTTTAQWFLSRGYGYAPAGKIAPVSYLTVVLAGIYGWLFWDEVPTLLAIVGYGVVFVAILLTIPREKTAASESPSA